MLCVVATCRTQHCRPGLASDDVTIILFSDLFRVFNPPPPTTYVRANLAASAGGHTDVVRLLLQAGAASDSSTERDHRPLHLAAQYGHSPVIHVRLSACLP